MSVYFMQQQAGEELIKIGFSDLPDRRLSTVRRDEQEPVVILAVIDGGREVERMLHKQLEADRVRGEWFRPSDRVLEMVQNAQGASHPKRHRSENVIYDETAEDMRIAFELIHEAVIRFGGGQARFAALEKHVFPLLHAINPMWTARRLRGLYGKENPNIPYWVIRNLLELVGTPQDKEPRQ
jgi:hypothetical protein